MEVFPKQSRYMSYANIAGMSFLLAGCASPGFNQGEVQKNWAMTLRQLGIVPVFPPREDIQVGDVYVSRYDPNSHEVMSVFEKDYEELDEEQQLMRLSLGMSSRIHRIDIEQALSDEYERTQTAPPTSADYNTILENPALAAIEATVSKNAEQLEILNKDLAAAHKAAADATAAVTKATYDKEDADKNLVKAQADLDKAKVAPVDLMAEQQQLAALQSELRLNEDDERLAERRVADAGEDAVAKASAERALILATRAKEDIQLQINRLNADITAKSAAPRNTSSQNDALNQAIAKQASAAATLTTVTRAKATQDVSTAAAVADLTPKIATAKAKLDASNETKKAIVQAGARFLYPQPQYEDRNIFSGENFPQTGGKFQTDNRVNRLRIVGFPEFASTSVSQGDLSALIPAEALAFNVSASDVGKVVVKIPAAESYGISLSSFYPLAFQEVSYFVGEMEVVLQDGEELNLSSRKVFFYRDKESAEMDRDELGVKVSEWKRLDLEQNLINQIISPTLLQVDFQNMPDNMVYFSFITEVFYARAIDINLFGASSFGGLLDFAKTPNFNSAAAQKKDAAETEGDDPQFSGVIESTAQGDTNDLLAGLRDNLGRTQQAPGGSVQMLSYSDTTIGLRRVYDRPIAIGYRGITVKYDLCSNYPKSGTGVPFEYRGDCIGRVVGTAVSSSYAPIATQFPSLVPSSPFQTPPPSSE